MLQLLARAVDTRRRLFTGYSAVGLALALPTAPAISSPPTKPEAIPAAAVQPEQRASKVVSLELDASVPARFTHLWKQVR